MIISSLFVDHILGKSIMFVCVVGRYFVPRDPRFHGNGRRVFLCTVAMVCNVLCEIIFHVGVQFIYSYKTGRGL